VEISQKREDRKDVKEYDYSPNDVWNNYPYISQES